MNTFILGNDEYSYYEDDSSFEEGEGRARQTEVEVFEVVGPQAHIAVVGLHLPFPDVLKAAVEAVIAAGDHVWVGDTITREDISYESISTFFNRYTMASAIVIHP